MTVYVCHTRDIESLKASIVALTAKPPGLDCGDVLQLED
jgi:hypothetical protein